MCVSIKYLVWLCVAAASEEDDIFAALGQELEHEDCSLLGGRDCDFGTAFLQTKSAYRWTLASEGEETSEMTPSFFQKGAEVEVGVVHGAAKSTAKSSKVVTSSVGEVHTDRSEVEDVAEHAERHAQVDSAKTVTVMVAESEVLAKTFLKGSVPSGLCLMLFFVASLIVAFAWAEAKGKVDEKPAQLIPQPDPFASRRSQHPMALRKLCSQMRQSIQTARLCDEEDVASLLPEAVGYDCALSRPVSSGQAVRLLVRIEGALSKSPPPLGLLQAPLSQRSCVFFSAIVEECTSNGAKPTQKKKVSNSVDFRVSLVKAPAISMDVKSDLLVLDTLEDNWSSPQPLKSLPQPWREFLDEPSDATFRFREDVLLVGSQVVVAGELLRDARGDLCLQPWDWSSFGGESWRTSWESEHAVLVSNDTTLAENVEGPKYASIPTDLPQPFLML